MTSMDLEKLKMTGAGRAIAVLTSGGDAQGLGGCICLPPSTLMRTKPNGQRNFVVREARTKRQARKLTGKASQSLSGDDDILDSLFGDTKQPVRSKGARVGRLNASSPTNNMFSSVAEEVRRDDLDFEDVSEADLSDVLKNLKGMDDMEADPFPSKKKLPIQTKSVGNEEPIKDSAVLESNPNVEGADEAIGGGKKPNAAPSSSAHNYNDLLAYFGKQASMSDPDDLLGDSLDDLLPDETRPKPKPQQSKSVKSVPSASASSVLKSQMTKTSKRDDKDDLLDALGFKSPKNDAKKKEAPLWFSK
ncbi:hypothetical protein AMECASPLE_003668, partial [Ameca splendens]